MQVNTHEKSWTESVRLVGEKVGKKIEALLREGNVRRIVVKQNGRTIAEFPLTLGVVGAAVAPPVAAIAAIAALVTECTVEIERIETTVACRKIESPAGTENKADPADETVERLEPALSR